MNSRILAVIAFAAALGIFFFYINPTLSGPIASSKAAIASDVTALAAADKYTNQVTKLQNAEKTIGAANLARLSLLVPDSVNNIGLILDLDALAARSGIQVSSIDVAPQTSGSDSSAQDGSNQSASSPYQSMDFSLSGTGGYTAFKAFVAGLEKSERLLDVQEISIQGSDTGVYTYRMKIRLYWLRQTPAL